LCERRAPYRNVRLSGVRVSGFDLPPSASVVAGSFWVWSGLPLLICSLVFAFALLVLASVYSVGCFVWQAWRVKRLVSVALHNSVLGLALRVSAQSLAATFGFCQAALPARLCGYRLFWVGVLGRV
ncbi:MAG: hypothetical protein Q7V20_17475, partial [Aquabacterium sp.]|uniref:hypothetical protein n=1 Tax=Aquabacterium sp. TaxID=1872578 RepID=UPI00271C0DF8